MTPIHAHMPVEVIRKEGALSECGRYAAEFGKRCLILTGGHSAQKNGALQAALASMQAAGVEAIVFPHISANPTIAQCRNASDAADAGKVHSILAIGGGSVMDAAKATAWMTENFLLDPEKLFRGELKRPPLPLMVCGTTAGTGSEVTNVAVITDDQGVKRSVKHPSCFARVAFCDPRYTDACPREVTVSTALDALCHAAEGYLNPSCDPLSTLYAERALPLIAAELHRLCAQDLPDRDGRDRLLDGSLLAGLVLGACGTAFPHPMGYVLTERFDIPHGRATAAFLPALLDCAIEATPTRAEAFFALVGGEARLRETLGILNGFSLKMSEDDLAHCAERFDRLPHFARVPGGFDGVRAAALCRTLFG
ncbi:MAG: iron-containing alcohol dehydrogenase [Clostridia bacterium]|nr:iron-containing alcohol dehydrogenase [Clostridia bacterium]